jgi:hemoglobin
LEEKTMASLYEQLGGAEAIEAAVEIFYRKVLQDPRIAHFFEDVDMDAQMAKQGAFLTLALGGPHRYTGRDMRAAHAPLVTRGLNDTHFDAVVEHLGATLAELGAAPAAIREVAALCETLRADILGRAA